MLKYNQEKDRFEGDDSDIDDSDDIDLIDTESDDDEHESPTIDEIWGDIGDLESEDEPPGNEAT